MHGGDTDDTDPAWSRRRLLGWSVLASAAWLSACGSKPRTSGTRTGAGRTAPRQQPALVPPSATPLSLDPQSREGALARALLVINTPYTYGGNTPEGGFDCSGLVHYVMSAEGNRRLPRSTAQWAAASTPVPDAQLKRGDLVFFNTSGARFSHMGIYVGDGKFVHAPSTGGTVRLQNLSDRYFAQRYTGARTVFADGL
jgi:cell wall-associated NlpC family hydrolase